MATASSPFTGLMKAESIIWTNNEIFEAWKRIGTATAAAGNSAAWHRFVDESNVNISQGPDRDRGHRPTFEHDLEIAREYRACRLLCRLVPESGWRPVYSGRQPSYFGYSAIDDPATLEPELKELAADILAVYMYLAQQPSLSGYPELDAYKYRALEWLPILPEAKAKWLLQVAYPLSDPAGDDPQNSYSTFEVYGAFARATTSNMLAVADYAEEIFRDIIRSARPVQPNTFSREYDSLMTGYLSVAYQYYPLDGSQTLMADRLEFWITELGSYAPRFWIAKRPELTRLLGKVSNDEYMSLKTRLIGTWLILKWPLRLFGGADCELIRPSITDFPADLRRQIPDERWHAFLQKLSLAEAEQVGYQTERRRSTRAYLALLEQLR